MKPQWFSIVWQVSTLISREKLQKIMKMSLNIFNFDLTRKIAKIQKHIYFELGN